MKGPIVVTGASGLLGRQVKGHLEHLGHEVVGLSHSREGEGLTRLDLTHAQAFTTFLGVTRPGVIIHCAAERRPDFCEGKPEHTQKLNVGACETLARYVEQQGASVVYLSTDYVFDGSCPPYGPDAKPNPLNAYGHSKLAGERVFLERVPERAIVLRVPILYGPVEYPGESQVTVLADLVRSGLETKVDDWAVRYPTFTPDVALAIASLLEAWQKNPSLSGVHHFSGQEALTKYQMCLAMAKVLGLPTKHLTPDPNPPVGAPRPKNSQLDVRGETSWRPSPTTTFLEGLRIVFA